MFEDEIPVGKAKDLRGKKIGNLTVLYRVKGSTTRWKCQCDCGNITYHYANNLMNSLDLSSVEGCEPFVESRFEVSCDSRSRVPFDEIESLSSNCPIVPNVRNKIVLSSYMVEIADVDTSNQQMALVPYKPVNVVSLKEEQEKE